MDKIIKEQLINEELQKLTKLFEDISEDKKKLVTGLINQAAFMKITLQELQELINENGSVEVFVNGSQVMNREYPALKSYNTTIKNYTAVIKQLIELLPEEQQKGNFDSFLNS